VNRNGSFHTGETVVNKSVEWLTPLFIFEALGLTFDLDPCGGELGDHVPARARYTTRDDGLSKDWSGTVWLNPPYGPHTPRWLRRLVKHGDGIALVSPGPIPRGSTGPRRARISSASRGVSRSSRARSGWGSSPRSSPARPRCPGGTTPPAPARCCWPTGSDARMRCCGAGSGCCWSTPEVPLADRQSVAEVGSAPGLP
jgi:hypothetical protein